MRETDPKDPAPTLGAPIRPPAPPPPPPRRFNADGTVWQRSDGSLETRIPDTPSI